MRAKFQRLLTAPGTCNFQMKTKTKPRAAASSAPITKPETVCECQNCGWKGPESALAEIRDFSERHEPGDTVGSGECPECGALAFPVDDAAGESEGEDEVNPWHLLEELGNAVMHLHDMGGSGGTEAEGRVRKALREAAQHVDIPIE
jgi:hypothetical protein